MECAHGISVGPSPGRLSAVVKKSEAAIKAWDSIGWSEEMETVGKFMKDYVLYPVTKEYGVPLYRQKGIY